jgi:hypothetical protein
MHDVISGQALCSLAIHRRLSGLVRRVNDRVPSHCQYLADCPPVSNGRRDAEQTFGVRGELGPSYPLGRMQVEEAILEGESLAITLDPFEGV